MKLRHGLWLSMFIWSAAHAGGEETYQSTCAHCHAQGLAGAPKVGDKKAWGKLVKEGLVAISADAYPGIRAMPAQGGRPDLSVPDFVSAVVYMANQSGATWSEPDEATLKKINARIERANKRKS
jgi:mono/diheme cytochrome c family protein